MSRAKVEGRCDSCGGIKFDILFVRCSIFALLCEVRIVRESGSKRNDKTWATKDGVTSNFYGIDYLGPIGEEDIDREHAARLAELLKQSGFHLAKWISRNLAVLGANSLK